MIEQKLYWDVMKVHLVLLIPLLPVIFSETGHGQSPAAVNQPISDEELVELAPEGVIVFPDISYREGNDAWKLDLAMPEDRRDGRLPAIIYIHGGG